jgi:hypothetical protein
MQKIGLIAINRAGKRGGDKEKTHSCQVQVWDRYNAVILQV